MLLFYLGNQIIIYYYYYYKSSVFFLISLKYQQFYLTIESNKKQFLRVIKSVLHFLRLRRNVEKSKVLI
jgi:hypothetical protein